MLFLGAVSASGLKSPLTMSDLVQLKAAGILYKYYYYYLNSQQRSIFVCRTSSKLWIASHVRCEPMKYITQNTK